MHTPTVTLKRGKIKKMAEGRIKELSQAVEKQKAQLRAYVEPPFHVLKNLFGYRTFFSGSLAIETLADRDLHQIIIL